MVYVDDMRVRYGRMSMCHMLADSDAELLAMASRIGVALQWHQHPGRHDSHFDICLSKKMLAMRAGARQITRREAAAMCSRRQRTGDLGRPEDALAWYRRTRATARNLASVQESA